MERGREEIAWADVAAVVTVGRFCGQASELGITESWYARTAFEALCGIPVGWFNDARLHRALDKVRSYKDRRCKNLVERYQTWFGVNFESLIDDVTSTFFKGMAEGNEKAARGTAVELRGVRGQDQEGQAIALQLSHPVREGEFSTLARGGLTCSEQTARRRTRRSFGDGACS
jgi:hypothetical protein